MQDDILKNLGNAVTEFNVKAGEYWAHKAIEEGVDPTVALGALTEAIRKIGDRFQTGECFLPELVSAAAVVEKATPIIEEKIRSSGVERKSLGKIVIGSVFGDIHSIGKAMVCSLLQAEGFEVIDLGVNIPADSFIKAIKEHDAQIVAMSALMTMTAPEMKKVIQQLNIQNLHPKVKVMVGGSAISSKFSQDIGADGYDATAPGAVNLARELLGI